MSSAEHLSSYVVSRSGDQVAPVTDRLISHPWLKAIHFALVPRGSDPLLDPLLAALPASLRAGGNRVNERPNRSTRVIVTSARFGEVISTKEALFFRAKLLFNLAHRPTVFTLVSVPRAELESTLATLEQLRDADEDALKEFSFPGMPATGLAILREEARRGGPIKAFSRLLQVQVKSVWTAAVIGDPSTATIDGIYLFDLVGGHPFVSAPRVQLMAAELGVRLATVMSTSQADHHEKLPVAISRERWERTRAPEQMIEAAFELGRRGYLTAPVHLKDFGFRALGHVIARQYSEGCLATYDPDLGVLLTTATGSARVVDKRHLSRGDIALVQQIKPDGTGARILRVGRRAFVRPSVEAVELARIVFDAPRFATSPPSVPVSIIHLHMGVAAYCPATVEYATLDPPFYAYPVSCGTRELADGTARAFARSSVLRDPEEARRIVVTEQPTHGCIIVALGGNDRSAFQQVFQAIDRGDLQLSFDVPQGPVHWQLPDEHGLVRKHQSTAHANR